MDPDEPTHFTSLILGTGLVESILAGALSKAGYSVLQLDQSPYYGDQWASLSLQELVDHAASLASPSDPAPPPPPPEVLQLSSRFNLSLQPTLLRATGPGIDLLVRSRVATYLSFGLLRGIGLWRPATEEGSKSGGGGFEVVPGTKADVFNHKGLGLVEKRRLTKFLLWAAGTAPLEEDELLKEPSLTFIDLVTKSFSITPGTAESLAYALALATSPHDLALPTVQRLRSIIHSTGRYGPSPFLVGHYGGAGDLIGGFSRICAVWGGGQILGRPILPLDRDPTPGKPVVPAALPFSGAGPAAAASPPPPKPPAAAEGASAVRPLGVPVQLDPAGQPATTFTADWVVAAPSHLGALFPSGAEAGEKGAPHTVRGIVVLKKAVPFPSKGGTKPAAAEGEDAEAVEAEADEEKDAPDSSLFVFPPEAVQAGGLAVLGTVTALQVASGTFACPEPYSALYLSAPLLTPPPADATPAALLQPVLDKLLAQVPAAEGAADASASAPVYSTFHFLRTAPTAPADAPANLVVVPELDKARGTAAGLVTSLDEAVAVAEGLFWKVVGEGAREEGVEFFAKEERVEEDD